jgi:hypothetical protein
VAVIDRGGLVALDTPQTLVARAGTASLDDAFLREPAAVFFTLAFPLLLLWLNGSNGNRPQADPGGRG